MKIGQREMHVEILTIVTRFMGEGFLPHFRGHVTASLKNFFQKFFHHDLGEEKSVTLLIGLLKNRSGSL